MFGTGGGVNLGSAHGAIYIDHKGAVSGIGLVQRQLGLLQGGLLGLNPILAVTGAGLVAMGAAAGGLAGAIVSSTKKAASLEEQLSGIQAVMGASSGEVEQLKQLITDLGIDPKLKVSATEAADAIEMLGRNGLDTEEILNGAARATVLLSNATGGAFATSADVATDVMALFGIEAANMEQAVDGITSVVTNSKFTIDDYRLALAQGGGVAASVGVDFDDFNTVIAGIAPLFASGSDAGTSFKTMLQRLVPQSSKAKAEMERLGIITEDGTNQFFDAQGNMKDMSEIAGILSEALSGLSEEQRNQALFTIFGTDAMRAAVGVARLGEQGFKDLQATMGETSAAEAAATRMDNLAGSIEILEGIIETLQLRIGDKFIPVTRRLVEALSEFLSANADRIVEFFEAIANRADTAADWLLNLGDTFKYLRYVWTTGDLASDNDWITQLPEDMREAIAWMGELTLKAREVSQAFGEGVDDVKEFGRQMQVLFEMGGIVAVGSDLGKRAEGLGRTIGRAIADGVRFILENREEARALLADFIETVIEVTPGAILDLRLAGNQVAVGFISGFAEGLTGQELSDEMSNALATGLGALSFVPLLGTLAGGPGIILGIVAALGLAAAQIPEVREYVAGLDEKLLSLWETLTAGEGPLGGLSDELDRFEARLQPVVGRARDFIADMQEALQTGKSMSEALWAWADQAEIDGTQILNSLLELIAATLREGRETWKPALEGWGDEIWNWVNEDAIPLAGDRLTALFSAIENYASEEGRPHLQEIGRQIGLDIVDVLKDQLSNPERAAEAVLALINALPEAARIAAAGGQAYLDFGSAIAGGVLAGIIEGITGEEVSTEFANALGDLWKSTLEIFLSTIFPPISLAFAADTVGSIVDSVKEAWENADWPDLKWPWEQEEEVAPKEIAPGSPSPLEISLRGIADAIRGMPSLSEAFAMQAAAAVPAAAGSSSTSTTTVGDVNFYISAPGGNPQRIADAVDERLGRLIGRSYVAR